MLPPGCLEINKRQTIAKIRIPAMTAIIAPTLSDLSVTA